MNDVGQAIRKGFFNALNGNITIEGGIIPIVDEKLDLQITEQDYYMLIGDQNENPANNKCAWAREVDVTITIANRRKATNSKTGVESVSDQMLQIIFPTRTSFGISVSSPFSLSYVRLTNSSYNLSPIEGGFLITKQLVFKTRITQ